MDFLFFSNTGWRTMDGAHRPARFAQELLSREHRVLFVELENSADKPHTDTLWVTGHYDLGISERETTRAWYGQAYGHLGAWRSGMQSALDQFERPNSGGRVAIWTLPFAPLVELVETLKARGYYLVYDCLDDFEGLDEAGYHLYYPQVEDYLVTQADLVVVLSTTLRDKFQSRTNRITLIRDGITLANFARVPAHKPDPPRLKLGFWGTITPFMVDIPLLEYIARERPQWQIDLIGPCDTDPLAPPVAPRLQAYSNIHLLGRQPHAALAQHLAGFDVCLLPSPVDRFNRGRDPVKLYEYLAGYRPVVVTDLPQLVWMPYVYLAHHPAEFVTRVEEAVAAPIDHAVVDRFLADQTWACRVDALLGAIAQNPPRASIAPFTPPAPKSSQAAAQAYIAHLEHLLDERTRLVGRMHDAMANAGVRPALRRGFQRIRDIIRRNF